MHVSEFKGKRVLIVGMGKTGVALARLLAGHGALVTVNDIKDGSALPPPGTSVSGTSAELKGLPCRFEFGSHRVETFIDQDLILVSPGVPIQQRAFDEARKRGIPISNDLELAFSLTSAPFLAVAGTNGKTTTTTLLGNIFRQAGRKIVLGGNIGYPLSPLVFEHPEAEFVIAEVSSFQLETIQIFRPRVGIMLNITPDHLDRYVSWEDYVKAKARLFVNQTAGDFALLNAGDPTTAHLLTERRGAGKLLFFRTNAPRANPARANPAQANPVAEEESQANLVQANLVQANLLEGVMVQGEDVVARLHDRSGHLVEERICSIDRRKFPGEHNQENVMAAALTAWLCGIDRASIQKSLDEFTMLSHRIELVAEIRGVRFIDDSKGTNVGAVIAAIRSVEGPVWLILGGKDKGNDYRPLLSLVEDRVKGIVAIGESREKVSRFFHKVVAVYCTDSFKDAVNMGFSMASPGDAVLLSPACASFDMFESYAHRGQVFKQLVQEIEYAQKPDL